MQANTPEMTRIIIGTVVASGDAGINAKELADKLNAEGKAVNESQMQMRLTELAEEGHIDEIAPAPGTGTSTSTSTSSARYEGV